MRKFPFPKTKNSVSMHTDMAIHYDIMNTIIITTFLFLIICWSLYYKHMKKFYDDKYLTPKDYTVLIKGLPSQEEN